MRVDRDQLKRAAALRAIEEVEDGMVPGSAPAPPPPLSSKGSPRESLPDFGWSASRHPSARPPKRGELGIPIATFAEHQRFLDLTIDGADEVQRIFLT